MSFSTGCLIHWRMLEWPQCLHHSRHQAGHDAYWFGEEGLGSRRRPFSLDWAFAPLLQEHHSCRSCFQQPYPTYAGSSFQATPRECQKRVREDSCIHCSELGHFIAKCLLKDQGHQYEGPVSPSHTLTPVSLCWCSRKFSVKVLIDYGCNDNLLDYATALPTWLCHWPAGRMFPSQGTPLLPLHPGNAIHRLFLGNWDHQAFIISSRGRFLLCGKEGWVSLSLHWIQRLEWHHSQELVTPPLPLLSLAFEQLPGAKIFTKLDLRNVYHPVRIRKGDKWKIAFTVILHQGIISIWLCHLGWPMPIQYSKG